jgi:deoxyribodipyrimidine photo-lyase
MRTKRAILWFRNDLRIHDNEALHESIRSADEVLPVYVFDPRVFSGKTRYGFPKTGRYRTKFIIECVRDLRKSFKEKYQADLIVRIGRPEEVLFDLANQIKSNWVFCNRERTQEEIEVQDALEKKLWSIGQEIRYSRGKMLYYTADLPFPVTHTPDIFSQFRKEVEPLVPVRDPLDEPAEFKRVSEVVDPGQIPSMAVFGWDDRDEDPRRAFSFRGGESAAMERLHDWIWEKKAIASYKDTRNELTGEDNSSHFSPWLAQGCLSPKFVYREVKRFEQVNGKSQQTYWLIFELMWRDFFRFMAKKHGNKIFQLGGLKGDHSRRWDEDMDIFYKWANGMTGFPLVDANMRELKETGFMSNRGRQNVASFFTKDLNLNWLIGASWFESLLIDYDPCSNYGNWAYQAGVGSDPKPDRHFNVISQARRYDPGGKYILKWVPELKPVKGTHIYYPAEMPEYLRQEADFVLGRDYPLPLVDPAF